MPRNATTVARLFEGRRTYCEKEQHLITIRDKNHTTSLGCLSRPALYNPELTNRKRFSMKEGETTKKKSKSVSLLHSPVNIHHVCGAWAFPSRKIKINSKRERNRLKPRFSLSRKRKKEKKVCKEIDGPQLVWRVIIIQPVGE